VNAMPELVTDLVCGMKVDSGTAKGGTEQNPELREMWRQFWISLALTVPTVLLSMSALLPGHPRHSTPYFVTGQAKN